MRLEILQPYHNASSSFIDDPHHDIHTPYSAYNNSANRL
jgi:hypothetical protein